MKRFKVFSKTFWAVGQNSVRGLSIRTEKQREGDMLEIIDLPREYFDDTYAVDAVLWDDFKEALEFTAGVMKARVEPSPVSFILYVSVRGIEPERFYDVFSETFGEKRSMGKVSDTFLRSSAVKSRDWNEAFSWIRELRKYFSGVALLSDSCEESRLMGKDMYNQSEVDDALAALNESIDMSIASSMYIETLKKTAMKQMGKLKRSNEELKKENEHLKSMLDKKK